MAEISLTQAFHARRSVRDFRDGAIAMSALNRMIWAVQGKTGAAGGKTIPSAHALYPLSQGDRAGRGGHPFPPNLHEVDQSFRHFRSCTITAVR